MLMTVDKWIRTTIHFPVVELWTQGRKVLTVMLKNKVFQIYFFFIHAFSTLREKLKTANIIKIGEILSKLLRF